MQTLLESLNRYDIYFNFFSFGSLLVTIFTGFLSVFILTIRKKSRATIDLGLLYLWFSLFFLGYFIAAAVYSPLAVYHRYFTLGFIFPSLLHFNQWIFRFPENTHPRVQRAFLIIQYLIAFIIIGLFVYITQNSGIKFHFNGHYWDFDAEGISRIGAYWIMAYILSVPAVAVWKMTVVKKNRDRWNILGILGCLVIGAIVPGVLNTLSRDGVVDRGFYLNALVLLSIAAFFALTILFINTTEDHTTFMAKIVGITMVTFLLLFQGMAYISMQDRETEYDRIHLQFLDRAVEGGSIDSEVAYLYMYRPARASGELRYSHQNYYSLSENAQVDFSQAAADFKNTAMREKIARLSGDGMREAVEQVLTASPPEFAGYRESLLSFVKSESFGAHPDPATLESEINRLNQLTLVSKNRISYLSDENLRNEILAKIENDRTAEFAPYRAVILDAIRANPQMNGRALKNLVFSYLAPFQPQYARHYRSSPDGMQHFISYTAYDPDTETVYEAGFFYRDYRAFIHRTAFKEVTILAAVLFVVLFIFPLFFRGALINPLTNLLDGVTQVNNGDFTIKVPVKVQDEIGFLAGSFNRMVNSIGEARDQLRDYANNLEEKVKERTAELNATLEEVRKLKIQQDGDYFLTSLLLKPLNYNANKSALVGTDFAVVQKKQFEFRNKHADVGGDICITGNLRLGSEEEHRRFIVIMNADAMGKSMQGAGGALVMGVVTNSILARSARQDRVLNMTPEEWLAEFYEEVNGVFQAFNGTMVISCIVDLIEEQTGDLYYFNAEHPFQVLYRDGRATFLEEDLQLRKLGLESEIPFQVKHFQLLPGDVLLAGSDGRDDIDLTPNEPVRTINEDERLFLRVVEEADGDLWHIVDRIAARGEITDDLSLVRIAFHATEHVKDLSPGHDMPAAIGAASSSQLGEILVPIIDIDDTGTEPLREFEEIEAAMPASPQSDSEFTQLMEKGQRLLRMGRSADALATLETAYTLRQDDANLNRILGVLTFREKDYDRAITVLEQYLSGDPKIEDFWLYLSIAHKRVGNMERALEAAERLFELNSRRVPNLLQLADLHFRMGNRELASAYLGRVFEIDPHNSQGKTLEDKIGRSPAGSNS